MILENKIQNDVLVYSVLYSSYSFKKAIVVRTRDKTIQTGFNSVNINFLEQKDRFSVRQRLKSFIYAFEGLKSFFHNEHNSRIHLISAVFTIILGYSLHLNSVEWCLVIIVIGLVIMAEIFNSAIETLTDLVSPNYNDLAKKVKDFGAAAVLIASITALCIGLILFIPKLLDL